MEIKILDKEYVLTHGVNFEELAGGYCSDRILDKEEEDGGKPFTGLTYELYRNNKLAYYSFYKDGFPNGDFIQFYENGNIKKVQYMKYGRVAGIEETWFESGRLKSVGESAYGVRLNFKEWNEEGGLIEEKLNPTEGELKRLAIEKEWAKRLGRD